MSDEAQVIEAPSTVLDLSTDTRPSGAGAPDLSEPDSGNEPNLRDTIAAAVDESKKGDADKAPAMEQEAEKPRDEKAADDKPDQEKAGKEPIVGKEEKQPSARAADGKFAAKEPVEPSAEKGEEKEDGHHPNPPASFMPDAKEKWQNVPRAVKREIDLMTRTHEAEIAKHREAGERYEPIRQFDEIARSNGRNLAESLNEVVRFENMMKANPVAALQHALATAGPRKADGQPLTMFEVAQAIVQQGPDGYQRMMAQGQQTAPQAPQRDPEVQALKQELAQMREHQLHTSVIEPFRTANPRYDELQNDIAFFLQSGKIPTSLSLSDRLAIAYDMAARINPASRVEQPAPDNDPAPGRAVPDLSGSKSIKSAPGGVTPDIEPDEAGSIRDLIEGVVRKQRMA